MKDVPGFENLYAITQEGKVWSYPKSNRQQGKWLAPVFDKDGYIKIALSKNGKFFYKRVHCLVAQTYIENPFNLPHVNHLNGVKDDNRIENLEWCTPSQNRLHSYKMGFESQQGEKNACAKLNEKSVREIRKKCATGERVCDIAREYGVHHVTIIDIRKRRNWAHVI